MEYTKLNIHQVYELNIIEFLNYASFCKSRINYHNAQEKKRIDEMKRGTKKR